MAAGRSVAVPRHSPSAVVDLVLCRVRQFGATVREASQLLWDMHHPYMVWVYLGAVGVVGTVGMTIFYFATKGVRTEE